MDDGGEADIAPGRDPAVTAASLARARKAASLTHRGMARRMGVDERAYRLLEAGVASLSPPQESTFRQAMSALASERGGRSRGRRNAGRTSGKGVTATPPLQAGDGVDPESGLEALVARRAALASGVADLKTALARAKAEIRDVELAIRARRTEIRARKALAAGEPASPQAMGGHARSLALSPDDRSRIASDAAKARWAKGGSAGG